MVRRFRPPPAPGLGPGSRSVPFRAVALLLSALVVASCQGAAGEGAVEAPAAGAGPAPRAPVPGPLSADTLPGGIPINLEPIVIPTHGREREGPAGVVREARPVGAADAGWAEKYDLARGYVAGGYEEEALTLIRAALAQEPKEPWRGRFQALRTSLRVRRLNQDVLRVSARGDRDYVGFDEDVLWTVRLRNVSDREIVLPAPEGGEVSPAALSLQMVRRDLDVYGAELKRTWNQTVYLQEPHGGAIRIPPHRLHEVPVRVPRADVGEPVAGLRILVLEGVLRGARIEVGEREETGSLPLRPGRVVVLPSGFEPLAQDPIGSMESAITAVAPTHLLVAAEFVPRDEAPRASEVLVRAIGEGARVLGPAAVSALRLLAERSAGRPLEPLAAPLVTGLDRYPDRRRPLMEALTHLTGQRLPADARLWHDWWASRRDRAATVPALAAEAGP